MSKIFALVLIVLIFSSFNNSFAETEISYCHQWVPPGTVDTACWDFQPEFQSCPAQGDNCVRISCSKITQIGTVTTVDQGWIVNCHLDDIQFKVFNVDGTITSINRNGKNFTFQIYDYLFIENCSNYPLLQGLKISLKNLTTDSNGNYSVFIPYF